jgi:hypothetical protein
VEDVAAGRDASGATGFGLLLGKLRTLQMSRNRASLLGNFVAETHATMMEHINK